MNENEKTALCQLQCATCAKKPKHKAEICHWWTGEVCDEWLDRSDEEEHE
jgi:hypothetical protein